MNCLDFHLEFCINICTLQSTSLKVEF